MQLFIKNTFNYSLRPLSQIPGTIYAHRRATVTVTIFQKKRKKKLDSVCLIQILKLMGISLKSHVNQVETTVWYQID